jgi:hypothetical protein
MMPTAHYGDEWIQAQVASAIGAATNVRCGTIHTQDMSCTKRVTAEHYPISTTAVQRLR